MCKESTFVASLCISKSTFLAKHVNTCKELDLFFSVDLHANRHTAVLHRKPIGCADIELQVIVGAALDEALHQPSVL